MYLGPESLYSNHPLKGFAYPNQVGFAPQVFPLACMMLTIAARFEAVSHCPNQRVLAHLDHSLLNPMNCPNPTRQRIGNLGSLSSVRVSHRAFGVGRGTKRRTTRWRQYPDFVASPLGEREMYIPVYIYIYSFFRRTTDHGAQTPRT